MKTVPFFEAYARHKQALPASFWGHAQRVDDGNAIQRVFRGLYEAVPEVRRTIQRSDRVFAIGSCFAGRIRHALAARDYELPGLTDRGDPDTVIYLNPFAMLDALRMAFDEHPWSVEQHAVHTAAGWVEPILEYVGLCHASRDELVQFRRRHERMLRAIVDCDVLIVTLGAADAFYDTATSTYVNQTPKSDPARATRYEFREHSAVDVADALVGLEQLVRRHRPGAPIAIYVSVSPQPLEGCFADADVVVASVRNKAVLRAAVELWRAQSDHVHYVPLFDCVEFSDRSIWASDLRHLSDDGFALLMRWFEKHYLAC